MWRRRLFRVVLLFLSILQAAFARPQSLAEAARKEAERRKTLERQGVEGKVIERDDAAGEDTRSAPAAARPSSKVANTDKFPKSQMSLKSVRSALRKLDLSIQQGEEKLTSYRARMEAEKWQLPKVGKISRASTSTASRDRLRLQIEELEVKVKRWRRERFEIYEVGRKAGYLPGELDGKGIVP